MIYPRAFPRQAQSIAMDAARGNRDHCFATKKPPTNIMRFMPGTTTQTKGNDSINATEKSIR